MCCQWFIPQLHWLKNKNNWLVHIPPLLLCLSRTDWSEEKGSKWGNSESQRRPCSMGAAGPGSGSSCAAGGSPLSGSDHGLLPRQGHEQAWGLEALSHQPPTSGSEAPSTGTGGASRGSTGGCGSVRGTGTWGALYYWGFWEFSSRDVSDNPLWEHH